MSLLNPLSTMKPLSFKFFSHKTKALSEMKSLTFPFLCYVLASLAPFFLFLVSSVGCLVYVLDSGISSSYTALD